MKSTVTPFATLEGKGEVMLYSLKNDAGMRADILNYGGILTALTTPGRDGSMADVVLAQSGWPAFIKNDGYLGAIVGRNSNRIAGASFRLNGKRIAVDENDGINNLHGGWRGLSFRLFDGELAEGGDGDRLTLRCRVADGSDRFPGNLVVAVTYTLTADALRIDYDAVCDADTVINLTNHAYFNLAGHDSGPVYNQTLQLDAPCYTPVAPDGGPSGEVLSVVGTPFDFTTPKPIGRDIRSDHPQVAQFGGFDHNFALAGTGYRRVGRAADPASGRVMTLYTDQPGVQLYTSNMMNTEPTYKGGAKYALHQGFCLETQTFPDAVNIPWFPSAFYKAGERYRSATAYRFTVE